MKLNIKQKVIEVNLNKIVQKRNIKSIIAVDSKNTFALKPFTLEKFLDAFEKQHGDTSLIDKNHHTASISDTQISYDVDLQRQYLLPENAQLFLIFRCFRLVNYIKTMNLACAYLEDIPSTGDSAKT